MSERHGLSNLRPRPTSVATLLPLFAVMQLRAAAARYPDVGIGESPARAAAIDRAIVSIKRAHPDKFR